MVLASGPTDPWLCRTHEPGMDCHHPGAPRQPAATVPPPSCWLVPGLGLCPDPSPDLARGAADRAPGLCKDQICAVNRSPAPGWEGSRSWLRKGGLAGRREEQARAGQRAPSVFQGLQWLLAGLRGCAKGDGDGPSEATSAKRQLFKPWARNRSKAS